MTFKLCIYKQISSLFITQKTLGTNLPVRPPCFAPLARDYWILGFQFDTLGVVPVVLDTLILSSIRCACPRYAVPVRDTLCLSLIHWAGLSLCLCLLGTEFWPWCRFITRQDSNGNSLAGKRRHFSWGPGSNHLLVQQRQTELWFQQRLFLYT